MLFFSFPACSLLCTANTCKTVILYEVPLRYRSKSCPPQNFHTPHSSQNCEGTVLKLISKVMIVYSTLLSTSEES